MKAFATILNTVVTENPIAKIAIIFLFIASITMLAIILVGQAQMQYPPAQTGMNVLSPGPVNAKEPEPRTYRLVFGGDVMLARNVGANYLYSGFDPFAQIEEYLRSADLTVVNLECVVSDIGVVSVGKLYTFRADPRTLSLLTNAGIDMVSVANNHSGDYGIVAFSDMLSSLSAVGIGYFGGGSNNIEAYVPKYARIGDLTVALLSFSDVETPYFQAQANSPGIAWFIDETVVSAIREARANADVVVVMPHWGIEYTSQIVTEQQRLAKLMIDAGADLIVGGHPHYIQQMIDYSGKKIIFSMGNLIFDGPGPNQGWYEGNLVEVAVKETEQSGVFQIQDVKLVPYVSDNAGQPKFM